MAQFSIQRRKFLKQLSIGSAILGANYTSSEFIKKTNSGILVQSEEEYGGFLVEKILKDKPYSSDPDKLKQMSNKMTVFSRNVWDSERQNRPESKEDLTFDRLVEGNGKIPNQTRLDYALYDGAWAFSFMGGGEAYDWKTNKRNRYNLEPWDPTDLNMSWKDASNSVKRAALFYGASLAGIAELNPLWIYSDDLNPTRENRGRAIPVLFEKNRFEQTDKAYYIPTEMNRAVSIAFEEDFYALENSPGRLASAAVGNGYSRMAFTARCLAEFIRSLGYRAIPAGNGVGLSIPIAIDAGLGELGRQGLLITPKYGPRVRLAKVLTDMPLIPDVPISFGVQKFCESCMLCAEHCPSSSVSKGDQTWFGKSVSNNPGILKWYIEPEKCYDFNGFSCSNCKRICPFTKPNNSWLHKMTRKFIEQKVGPLDKIMVTLDQASGYGKEVPDFEFWKNKNYKSITERESM